MRNTDPADLMTATDVSKADGTICPATVRQWADNGKLPTIRTVSGVRLFRRADVERLIAERRNRAAR